MSNEIKSQPIPGYKYIVKSGQSDWLSNLAARAYGDPTKWLEIANANQQLVQGPDAGKNYLAADKQWFIAGDIIFIPVLPELEKFKPKRITGKGKNDFTIVIEDIEIPVLAGRIIRTMDTAADGWTGVIQWVPGKNPDIDRITSPFYYASSQAYIGNELLVNGKVYKVIPKLANDGRTKELAGFSLTADIIDSNLQPPYEKAKINLFQRAQELCRPHGISVEVDEDTDFGGTFSRVTASENDKIFNHLNELARQRSVLLSSTPDGNLLLTNAKIDSEIVGTISEANLPAQEFSAEFDGRKRFGTYRVLSQTPKKGTKKVAVSKDPVPPGSRFATVSADDNIIGENKNTADWIRNKNLVETLTKIFPVSGWYAPNGSLWRPNTLIEVISPTMGIDEGFTFLIHRVEYIFEDSGRKANLSILPPQVYSGEPIDEPWLFAGAVG